MNGIKKQNVNILKKAFKKDLEIMNRFIENYDVIVFKRMTTEIKYLQEFFSKFGIEDVKIIDKIINKKINTRPKKFEKMSALPFGLEKFFEEESAWFLEKHKGLIYGVIWGILRLKIIYQFFRLLLMN